MKTHETCSLDWTGAESKSGWEEVGDGVWKVSPSYPRLTSRVAMRKHSYAASGGTCHGRRMEI